MKTNISDQPRMSHRINTTQWTHSHNSQFRVITIRSQIAYCKIVYRQISPADRFTQRDCIQSAVLAIRILLVCLSDHISHVCTVTKRRNLTAAILNLWYRMKVNPCSFLTPTMVVRGLPLAPTILAQSDPNQRRQLRQVYAIVNLLARNCYIKQTIQLTEFIQAIL